MLMVGRRMLLLVFGRQLGGWMWPWAQISCWWSNNNKRKKRKKERKEKEKEKKKRRRKRERIQEQNQLTYLPGRGSIAPIYLE